MAESETLENTQEPEQVRPEELIDTYNAIAEWIRFADAKAAVVLTAGGALASVLIPTLKPYIAEFKPGEHLGEWWLYAVVGSFLLWLFLLVLSCISAFLCIRPLRRKGRHPALETCKHFHPAAISTAYTIDQVEDFQKQFAQLGADGFRKEVVSGVLIDAHISSAKYSRVGASIRLLAASSVFGFLYLFASQF